MSRVDGVDVSIFQGAMAWELAYARGARFMAARATVGNYYTDPQFHANADNAPAAGLWWTAYHVVRPDNDATTQTNLLFSHLGGRRPDLPIVLDVEVKPPLLTTNKAWQPANYVSRVLQVADMIKQRDGRDPILYTYPDFINSYLKNDPRLARFKLWISNTSGKLNVSLPAPYIPAPFTGWKFWQHLTDNSDDGPDWGAQSRALDRNWYNGDLAQMIAEFGLAEIQPGQPPAPLTLEERVGRLESDLEALERAFYNQGTQSPTTGQNGGSTPVLTPSDPSGTRKVKAEKAVLFTRNGAALEQAVGFALQKGDDVRVGATMQAQPRSHRAGVFGELTKAPKGSQLGLWVRLSDLT